jgi:hypothetical protein
MMQRSKTGEADTVFAENRAQNEPEPEAARAEEKSGEVRGLGLEPRTNWLKANCSTN